MVMVGACVYPSAGGEGRGVRDGDGDGDGDGDVIVTRA